MPIAYYCNSKVAVRLVTDSRKRVHTHLEALSAGLFEDQIAAFREGIERWIRSSETLGGGAEEGEAGDELENVGAVAHQLREQHAAGELLADGAGDFFVAGAQERVAQVIAGLRQIADRISASGGGTAEAGDLREDVPDPMVGFAAPANLRERGFVAGGGAGLGGVEAGESFQKSESEVNRYWLLVQKRSGEKLHRSPGAASLAV